MRGVVITLLLIVCLALGLSVYLNWISFSVGGRSDDSRAQGEIGVTINKDKVKQDVATAQEKADEIKEGAQEKTQQITDQVKNIAGGHTTKGKLESVDLTERRLKVKDADKTLTINVTPETRIRLGEKDGTLAELKSGDPVTVVHLTSDGVHVAKSVTVDAK